MEKGRIPHSLTLSLPFPNCSSSPHVSNASLSKHNTFYVWITKRSKIKTYYKHTSFGSPKKIALWEGDGEGGRGRGKYPPHISDKLFAKHHIYSGVNPLAELVPSMRIIG